MLTGQAGTTSRYSTGETPPIKAGQPEPSDHLRSTCLRGNTSTRIWMRALQPDQEEVSSWRFCRAQIVSGRQTFPPIFWLGAGILTAAIVLSYAWIFTRRLYFVYPPIFCTPATIFMKRRNFEHPPEFSWDTGILDIRHNFHETPEFWASPIIFMRRWNFGYPPVISHDANILCICWYFRQAPTFYNFAWFYCWEYLCIFSVFIYAFEYAPIFLAQLF